MNAELSGARVSSDYAGIALSDIEGSVTSVEALGRSAGRLVIVVSPDCDVSRDLLGALQGNLESIAVVVQGHMKAAQRLARHCGLEGVQVLVERRPYPLSESFDVKTSPTLLLLGRGGILEDRRDGWLADDRVDILRSAGVPVDESALPKPRPGCVSRNTLDDQTQILMEQADAAEADWSLEMWETGWNDGLPVVQPESRLVQDMLGAVDGSQSLGRVHPSEGEVTFERLAACSVLAGCDPSYFSVVVAAAQAVLAPSFNHAAIQGTTHSASCLFIVNGPVRTRLSFCTGSHSLGFGTRVNATIGRAIRLMMILTGGAKPGGADPATLGGPHKYGLCIAENEELSPWPPHHVDLGFQASSSVVTASVGYGPVIIEDHFSDSSAGLVDSIVRHFLPTADGASVDSLVVLCPLHARLAATGGLSKQAFATAVTSGVREELIARGVNPSSSAGSQRLDVIVSGADNGGFSALLAPWGGFQLDSNPVSREIVKGGT